MKTMIFLFSEYRLETMEYFIFGVLALVGVMSMVVMIGQVREWNRDYKKLTAWRAGLSKGEPIRVRGIKRIQYVYKKKSDGVVIKVIEGSGIWYRTVSLTDIYPVEAVTVCDEKSFQ